MDPELGKYIHQFTHLRSDRTGGWTELTRARAPHKPFLLLAVLDLVSQARLTTNWIVITPELGESFASYWSRIMPSERRGNLALPFFHLRSSPFWHLIPVPGKEEALKSVGSVGSLGQLHKLVLGASLDEALFRLLQEQEARDILRTALIETYFSEDAQPDLRAEGDLHLQAFLYSQKLIEQARQQIKESAGDEEGYQTRIRDQGFRRAVVTIYAHRCAFCGLRLMTSEGRTVVDAAHIIPWRISQDDDVHNGMALCRLCHWSFDQGLLGVSARYLLQLSEELRLGQNLAGYLTLVEFEAAWLASQPEADIPCTNPLLCPTF